MARALHLQPRRGFADLGLRLAACATAPSPKLDTVEPPCHVLQEGRTLEGCQRRRELAQQRHLMVSEAKCLHVRGSDMNGRSFPRAIARSRRSRKRMSIFSSCSRDHPPTTSSPGCSGVPLPFRYVGLRPRRSWTCVRPGDGKAGSGEPSPGIGEFATTPRIEPCRSAHEEFPEHLRGLSDRESSDYERRLRKYARRRK